MWNNDDDTNEKKKPGYSLSLKNFVLCFVLIRVTTSNGLGANAFSNPCSVATPIQWRVVTQSCGLLESCQLYGSFVLLRKGIYFVPKRIYNY